MSENVNAASRKQSARPDELKKLKTTFNVYASVQKDGHRYMTESDVFQAFGVERGHELYENVEKTDRSLVSFQQFVLMSSLATAPKTLLEEAFTVFDTDNDGMIGLQEFNQVVKHARNVDLDVLATNTTSATTETGTKHPESSLLQKYFGDDGNKKVTYDQFADLVQELNLRVLHYRWRSLNPDSNNTVPMISIGRLLIRTASKLPPVLANNLISQDNASVRMSYRDFCIFHHVLDNLEELESRLELELQGKKTLTKAAFEEVVRAVSERRLTKIEQGSEGSGSIVMDTLFKWLDTDQSGQLDVKEVKGLLPLLQQTKAVTARPLALWENIVLGGSAAAIAGTAVYPMDTLKARIMNGQAGGIGGIFMDIVRKQGLMGLYRGLPAQLIGIMPEKALKLTLYNTLRTALMDKGSDHASVGQEMLAGAGTGLVQVAITNPYELIKIRQQTSRGEPISQTISELGVRGLTKGLGACLLRDIPFNVLYFSSYAALKDAQKPPEGALTPTQLMIAGLGAGVFAGGLSTPADVIKTRMQSDKTGRYRGLADCMRQMWGEGPHSFLKGLGPRLMLIPPMFAITMTCFETFQRMWFPQTVANHPALRPMLPRHTSAELVRNKLKQLEERLEATSSSSSSSRTVPAGAATSAT